MKKYIKIIIVLIIIFSLISVLDIVFAITDIENEEEQPVKTISENITNQSANEMILSNDTNVANDADDTNVTDDADDTNVTDDANVADTADENDETITKYDIVKSELSKEESNTVEEQEIEEGIYIIKSALDEKYVLDIYGNSKEKGANLELWTSTLRDNQKFSIKKINDGTYSISPISSNKMIDVEGNSKEVGANVMQWDSTGRDNQKWLIKKASISGYYKIISKSNGLCLDILNSEAKQGANIQVSTDQNAKNQMFKFEKQSESNKTLNDGIYTIKTALNENYVFDICGNSKENGANLELWTSTLRDNQKFKVEYLNDGSYSILPLHSNKSIDVEGNYKTKGTNVEQWQKTSRDNQRWYIKDVGNGYYNIISKSNGLYLDIAAGNAKSGANVQVWINNGGKGQMFKFEESSNQVIANGTYSIRNVSDYRVLDVSGNSTSNGGNVVVWENKSGNNQQFKLNYTTDGYYTITASHSGKCLDVEDGSKKSGTNVIQWPINGKDNQKWTIKNLGNGYYNIISKCNGLYLTQSSGNICVMNANNSNNQKFQFYNPSSLAKFSTGTYGKSGLKVKGDTRGTDLKYYKYGTGSNVFFATFCLHGFEDAWNKDGGELVKIADAFYEKLKANNDISLANKWTIYIFPEVNPDGRNYGTTNNGPGRTTLYSADTKHKGIDLNRCWSTSFSAITNNDRNYTGKTSFLAYEARYLRDFLLANKSKNGQTLLVDLHGWTQQLIGDATIRGYYKKYFPENEDTPTYGKGYMINWARTNLGSSAKTAKSALIELPSYIRSASDVTKYGLKDKYINATLNMLKGII